jgi:uncharacterized protein
MLIDSHTHAYEGNDRAVVYGRIDSLDSSTPDEDWSKWVLRLDPAAESLLEEEKAAGVDRFVLLPISGRVDHALELNRWVCGLARRHPAVIPFGTLVADSPTLEQDLAQALELGVRGFKIHPLLQRLDILSPEAHGLWSLLEEAGLPVVLDSMSIEGMLKYKPHLEAFAAGVWGYETGPERIAAVASKHTRLTLIAAHLGSLFGWDRLEPLFRRPNVFFDLSFVSGILPDREVLDVVRKRGPDRVLFGTDAPWRRPMDERRWFEGLPMDDRVKEAIAWKNMEALLDRRPGGGGTP